MTNEKAKKMLEAKLKCFIAETSGTNHDCNMRLCDGCALNYEQGNMGEQKQALDIAIQALERASCIKEKCAYCPHCEHCDVDDETLEIKALEQQPDDDCISRAQALHACCDEWNKDYKAIMKSIRQLPSVTPQQATWIPVSERLPETDGVYNVTRRLFDKQIDMEPYLIADACYFDGSNTWHNDNRINHSRHILEDVIAWMPLPQPYRESEE